MSGRIVGEVLDNAPENLTTAEFTVLMTLAATIKRGRRAQIKHEQLVRRTRLKPGAVAAAIHELIRRELITPVPCDLRRGQAYTLRPLGPWDREGNQTSAATPAAANERGDTP